MSGRSSARPDSLRSGWRPGGRSRWGLTLFLSLLTGALAASGCTTARPSKPTLRYDEASFREEILERVPGLSEALSTAPFLVPDEAVALATARIEAVPFGPDRVQALVRSLTAAPPAGFGLAYSWRASASASRTLETGVGNCVSMASVLVGLGRGLGWPIYYAEARTRTPETHEFEEITAVSDHMVVIVVARTVRMIVDFTGQVSEEYSIRPIDDLTAYAHLINNIAGQRVMDPDRPPTSADWEAALDGFRLAARIQPELGRVWNNIGIALTRLERFDEAREAYQRAVELDTAFGSAERNLTIMETRATGEPTLITEDPAS